MFYSVIVITLIFFLVGTVRNIEPDNHTFTTEVTFKDVADVTWVDVRIWSATEFVFIVFDTKTYGDTVSINIPAWKNEIYIHDNIVAPTDTNTNMTIDVSVKLDSDLLQQLNESSKSVADVISERSDMFIDAVNTTAVPPKFYELIKRSTVKIFFIDVKGIDGTLVNLTISIPAEFVQYGCVFSLSVPENASTDFVQRLTHGVSIKILSPVTNYVVPEGTVAVYRLPNVTYIYYKSVTLSCLAMGNPHPEVTLYKHDGQDYISLEPNQEELIDNIYQQMVHVVYTVEAGDINNLGRYLCR